MEPPGIEPRHTACKAAALPLSYGPIKNFFINIIIMYIILWYKFLPHLTLMVRDLSDKESSVLNKFSTLKLKEWKDEASVNMSVKKQKFYVDNPKIYEIEDTDSILILGEPRQVMDMNFIKKFCEEQLRKQK